MLFAVQPHLTSMALLAPHGQAASLRAEQPRAHHETPCPEPQDLPRGQEQHAKAGMPCCAAWNCGLLDKVAMPRGDLIRRIGDRLAAVAPPTPAGVTVEPGERPPRG